MFKSILTTALRNILRNRSFSLINLVGLSISMSLALLIILVIREQYSFDTFHQDSERIYRINTRAIRVAGGSEDYASSPLPVAEALRTDYTLVDNMVRVNARFNGDAIYGSVNVPMRGLLADQSFLHLFNFPLEQGNPATALVDPRSVVLTREAKEKLFGTQDALGRTISVSGYGEFTVTGVLRKFEGRTHFEFQMLGSMNVLPTLEHDGIVGQVTDNWNDYYSTYTYFKLKPGKTTAEVEDALASIAKNNYKGLRLETRDKGYEFFLINLREITPGPLLSNQMGQGMPELLIYFLSALVSIVMLMACFNYTNLMIAKSLSRAREIGVRKIVGAQRFQVFLQFVSEAVVFAIIALGFSYLIMQALKPGFMQLNIAREFGTQLNEDYTLYLYFVMFAVMVGIIAGLLPAGYLSAFKPASVLKDSNIKVYSKLTFRKALIVTQFTLSIAFIIVVLVVYRQVNYMVSTDYGINDKNILNIRLQGMDFDKLANEVKALPGVVSVGGVSHSLGTWADRASDYKRNREDESFVMRDFVVDENYINNLNLVFLSGENFNTEQQAANEAQVILNEQALTMFNFKDAVSAVGQTVYTNDSTMLTVRGVVKDFHFRPLSYQIGPLALRYRTADLNFVSAKIVPSQKDVIIASVEAIWKKLDNVHPVDYKMMEDEIDDAYTQGGFLDILTIVGYISFLAISLACLGMLGMAMYSTQTRMKEIGVRKVMGATSRQVATLLSRSFLILLTISTVIGIPIGYFFGDLFLSNYAYKIEISPALILIGIMVVGAMGFLTVWSQTWKAAASNPVKSLRYE
ncbi:MAG TPA: ABC transporter permease [Chryseosolibacter sp.]